MIAIVANVLNSDVFKSEGSKSSTNSLRLDFSSREKLLLTSFNSIAEFGLEYLFFRFLIASFIEFISELVISERSFFVIGLPFKYRTASTLVTRSMSDISLVLRSDWMIFFTEIFPNLPYIYSDAPRNNLYVSLWVSSQNL